MFSLSFYCKHIQLRASFLDTQKLKEMLNLFALVGFQ